MAPVVGPDGRAPRRRRLRSGGGTATPMDRAELSRWIADDMAFIRNGGWGVRGYRAPEAPGAGLLRCLPSLRLAPAGEVAKALEARRCARPPPSPVAAVAGGG